MNEISACGYAGKLLRVDLTDSKVWDERLDMNTVVQWVGGVGLGIKYLFEEVPPGVDWSDPQNRLIWTAGPLAGTGVAGAGTINIMARGPMTLMAGSSQANGFFGAYLKFCGYDGIIIQGKAPRLVYLLLRPGTAEVLDARHLAGKSPVDTENRLKTELAVAKYKASIFGIGPAGEHLVRYAGIIGDGGHSASHNGLGAVMGSKNLKAVVALKSKPQFTVFDPEMMRKISAEMVERAKKTSLYKWGTGGNFSNSYRLGVLPVKNYMTNIYPEHERMNSQYLRSHFKIRSRPCYKCAVAHVKEVTVTEGPYTGFVGEEPEYEMMAAWGPQIGNTDLGAVVMLSNEVDALGMDCNETSWVIGWAMECFEKGVLTSQNTDGLELSWGNVEVVKTLMNRIARREGGFAKLLADGVMRASKQIGGKTADWAIYGQKGTTPRSHDHRGRWYELFDTCVTNTSTLESLFGALKPEPLGLKGPADKFSHEQVSTYNARQNGFGSFVDSNGICRFVAASPTDLLACFNAVTGWDWQLKDAMTMGRRVVNLLRVFNLGHGMDVKKERPSMRYGSVPIDGPNKGVNIMEKWDEMVSNYYTLMGWDPITGEPLPETLDSLGLSEMIESVSQKRN